MPRKHQTALALKIFTKLERPDQIKLMMLLCSQVPALTDTDFFVEFCKLGTVFEADGSLKADCEKAVQECNEAIRMDKMEEEQNATQ